MCLGMCAPWLYVLVSALNPACPGGSLLRPVFPIPDPQAWPCVKEEGGQFQ